MSGIIVDTSLWIEFFKKGTSWDLLEQGLQDGRVWLSPIVAAELLSGVQSKKESTQLQDFLQELPLYPTPFKHWIEVGKLRSHLLKLGYSVSIPDAHLAQCALECQGPLLSLDKIFQKIAKKINLHVIA